MRGKYPATLHHLPLGSLTCGDTFTALPHALRQELEHFMADVEAAVERAAGTTQQRLRVAVVGAIRGLVTVSSVSLVLMAAHDATIHLVLEAT